MLKTALLAGLAAALLAAPALASGPDVLLYERALMLEADRRCTLFTQPVRTSLRVAAAQARGAARRAGQDPDKVEDEARKRAAAAPCNSRDLQTAAARVRAGHEAWARVQHMNFPGVRSQWRVDRTPSGNLRWRLVQSTPAATLGLAGSRSAAPRLYAVARFRKNARPALVRLSIGRRVYLAETRSRAPKNLTPQPQSWGRPPAWAFRFPAAATVALDTAGADDVIRIDFITPGRRGEQTRSVVFERGDLPAARAFSKL